VTQQKTKTKVVEPEVMDKNAPAAALKSYLKNETPEQREARLAKARETRRKNARENRLVTKQVDRLLKSYWKYKDPRDDKIKIGTGAEVIAATMIKEAMTVGGKNTIQAQKQILQLAGELKEDNDMNGKIVVQFTNKDIDF
jgi:hypothetical protein